MEFIFDFIFELIIDGSFDAASNKKVPMAVRVISAIILIAFFGGIIGFCIFLGIRDRNWVTLLLIALILIAVILQALRYYRKYKDRK